MKAMIFAAGLGTRLKPYTDTMPKALVPVAGVPMLKRVITRLTAAGYDDIVINVHHFADQIKDYVAANGNFSVKISYSDETDLLRETGGGLRHATPLLNDSAGPVLIHNVDIISDLDLEWFRNQHQEGDLATILVSDRKTARYFLFDSDRQLVGWTNVETGEVRSPYGKIDLDQCEKLAFSGVHMVSPMIFDLMKGWPEKFPIVDFYLTYCRKYIIRAAVPQELRMFDIGKAESLDSVSAAVQNLQI